MDELGRSLGRVIAEARKRARLSQQALASRSELHWTYISQLETGKKSPTVRALTQIATSLGVQPSDLLEQAERNTRSSRDGPVD
jgi:transcriptional regulator with XRE-family HTH domain